MPNRIVRESILDSPRYLSCDEGAQLLFDHIMLLADDFGCLSVEHTFLGRRCFAARPTGERLDHLLNQLARVDLIRPYEHRGIHYAFIPRFRQRLKRETLKNPQPPRELLEDDPDAQEKFKRLNGHAKKPAAEWRPEGGYIGARQSVDSVGVSGKQIPGSEHPTQGSEPPAHRREEKGSEGKGSEEKGLEEEVKAAPAITRANPVAMAEALAEKMLLKKSFQNETANGDGNTSEAQDDNDQ